MKLSKKQLIKSTKNSLCKLGYYEIPDSITGANGLFIKSLSNGFFLTLGLEISQFYKSKFTASFYLSKTTRWGSSWGDIPDRSYERIGFFLTKEERLELLSEEYIKEGVIDAWWDGFNKEEIEKFFIVVSIAELRFLEQTDLLSKVENSIEIKELAEYASTVFSLINENNIFDTEYQFIPLKTKDNIPIEWYIAAEKTIKIKKGILNQRSVALLAADAWRQKQVLDIEKSKG
jgi:hypothetical protein